MKYVSLYFEHTAELGIYCEVTGTRYRYVRVCTCLFAFFGDFVLPLGPFRVCFFTNYTRTADQNVTSPTNTQHSTDRATSSAQVALGIIKSRVAPSHGPLLSAPFTFS